MMKGTSSTQMMYLFDRKNSTWNVGHFMRSTLAALLCLSSGRGVGLPGADPG